MIKRISFKVLLRIDIFACVCELNSNKEAIIKVSEKNIKVNELNNTEIEVYPHLLIEEIKNGKSTYENIFTNSFSLSDFLVSNQVLN